MKGCEQKAKKKIVFIVTENRDGSFDYEIGAEGRVTYFLLGFLKSFTKAMETQLVEEFARHPIDLPRDSKRYIE